MAEASTICITASTLSFIIVTSTSQVFAADALLRLDPRAVCDAISILQTWSGAWPLNRDADMTGIRLHGLD